MEERIKVLETGLSTVSQELVLLKQLIVDGFKKVDNNFTIIVTQLTTVDKKVNELKYKLETLDGSTTKGLGDVGKKVNDLTYRLENLDGNTTKGLGEVGDKIETLTEEIQKIGIVTKYDEMYQNQKGLS